MEIDISVRIRTGHPGHRHLIFKEKSRKHNPAPAELTESLKLKGLKVIYQLADDTAVTFSITAEDEYGNPTTTGLGTPTVTSSDPTIVTVAVGSDNASFTITPVGKLGTAQIVVTDPVGTNPTPLTGTIDLTVVAGTATQLVFTPGATTPVTPPAPPAPTP